MDMTTEHQRAGCAPHRETTSRHATPDPAIALPWYDPQTYEQIRAVMVDGEHFASFAAWEIDALRTEGFFVAKGWATQRIHIEPAAFSRWCEANGRQADASCRVAYAEWVARRDSGRSD